MKKGYALVVGIAHYQSNALEDLKKPHLDAEAVAQVLENHGYFQNVTRLPANWLSSENRDEVAKEEQLTSEELTKALKYLLLEQAKDSEAVIYSSGHGIALKSKLSGKPEGFLATSDCEVEMEGQQVTGQKNGISLRELNDLIREAKVSSLVVLLDCCHAGSLLENDLVKQTLTALEKDCFLIAACRPQEEAYEGEEYSIFTEALLNGLSEKQAGTDGTITCNQLFSSIDKELKGKGQEPIYSGYGRSITLVSYQRRSQESAVKPLLDLKGEIRCPYQGLLAFTQSELPFFFGRQEIVEELARKLERQPFVSLIGASGSGKSSVVLAGLVPRLEELGWQVLGPLRPGFKPLARLEEVLREKCFSEEEQLLDECIYDESSEGLKPLLESFPQGRHLLVVDQFEELFTVAQAKQRDRFIQLITQVADFHDSPLAIVTTMRADFLEPCLYYDSLRKLIEEDAKYLPNLAGTNLIDAICEPAKRQGYEVTKELLNQILIDIKLEPGFLPLLEFALNQLWEKRDEEHKLTLGVYKAIGGVIGALNRHADDLYKQFTEREQEWVKRIFMQLLQLGEGTKDIRKRQSKQNLLAMVEDNEADQEAFSKVLKRLIDGRLLVTGQEGEDIDLAHEALIEGWEKLNQWRQENRELRQLAERIENAYQAWVEHQEDSKYLLDGVLREESKKNLQQLKDFVISKKIIYFCERSFDVFSFETGIDYRSLDELLKAQEWSKANDETFRVMLKAAKAEKKRYLESEDVDRFPCEDLQIINKLWLRYSGGKFGFSVQKEIYQSLGGTNKFNHKVWENFCDLVGWKKLKERNLSSLTFDLNAPQAHLPRPERERDRAGSRLWGVLFYRAKICNL